MTVRTPKVSVTTSVVTRSSVPIGRGHGNREPVVAVDQRELHHQQLGEVNVVGIELTEVGDCVLEVPPARIGHAAKNHMVGQEVEIDRGDLRGIGRMTLRSACALSRSNEYQSRCPPGNSGALSNRFCSGAGEPSAKA